MVHNISSYDFITKILANAENQVNTNYGILKINLFFVALK
jgi:hypothetical protein